MKKIKKKITIKDQLLLSIESGYACTGFVIVSSYGTDDLIEMVDIDLEQLEGDKVFNIDKSINRIGITGKLVPLVGKSKVRLNIELSDLDKKITDMAIEDDRFMLILYIKRK